MDSSTTTVLEVLKAIKSPVHIEISGETDGSFIRSLKETSARGRRFIILYHPYETTEAGSLGAVEATSQLPHLGLLWLS
ncbi:hypothetical protein M407DRAFT_26090 [Tulasnella calospora MUT 4182]|uniref:Uncharacterized protein n=1 Tax=Tulasnella calospora MUT 4182 TaxID=1051891 RepID=A0A0C3Q5P2_9AGAM|nr:hypothetical protein M407DRAFT_26090 [Tulasnella calospora MUT 4182]